MVKASAARALGREAPRPDGSQLSDRYQLIERTGATAGGQAYTGKDNALDRPVAVKVLSSARALDPIRRQRFFHEARIAAQLRHPNKPADLRPRPDPGRRNRLHHRAAGGQPLDVALRTVSWGKNAKRGHVRNVRFDQINLPDGIKPCIRIEGSERKNQIDQVRFSGLRLNVQGLNDTVSAEVGFNIFTTAVSFRE